MFTSTADVATDAAARYAKQLASHLGRKAPVEELPDGGFRLTIGTGDGVLEPRPDRLVLRATAPDLETLGVVQDVLGRHLVRFGRRNELTVTWQNS